MFLNADERSTETGQISRCAAGCSRWWIRRLGRPGRRRSVDHVVAGEAQTTEEGAVGVVPRLGETQQVDSTVSSLDTAR